MSYTSFYKKYLNPDCPFGMAASTRRRILNGTVSRATLLGWRKRGQKLYNSGYTACPTMQNAYALLPSAGTTKKTTTTKKKNNKAAPKRPTRQRPTVNYAALASSKNVSAAPKRRRSSSSTGQAKKRRRTASVNYMQLASSGFARKPRSSAATNSNPYARTYRKR